MNPIDNITRQFSFLNTDKIGSALEEQVSQQVQKRRRHERRWYEDNWFDDGYHFKVVSRRTGQVIDRLSTGGAMTERAIPRASRQIRGVSNLLFAAEPYPVVYPKRISMEQFRQNGQIDLQAYKMEMEKSKESARKQGVWLTTEWEDKQNLSIKLIDMMLKSAKNSISYMQVYSDTDKQEICTDVYDAFDIILEGEYDELQKVPMLTKARPRQLTDIQADKTYSKARLDKLQPDNRYATSEVKEAYMLARYGSKGNDPKKGSIMEKETFLKEYLNEENWKDAVTKGEENGAMEGKSKGDCIMRHVFHAGGVTLLDEYVNYDKYPFADFRFEPGYLYQKPFIENFIPQNKSLDIIMTRLEKWINAMVVGVYQVRKGENFQISNFPGGQKIEYETVPATQMQASSVGATPFNVISLLDKYIEEQGASTSALNQIPGGVKSGTAIESVKATEYANLKIPTLMLKNTIKTIAELMLERGDKDILEPKEVSYMNDGNADYFDVIGQRGYDMSQQVGKQLPEGITVLNKNTKVHIEIEPGLGLTMEGKRQAMSQIIEFMATFSEQGKIPPEALNMAIKKFLETFGYGNTQEFMEAIENGATEGDLTEEQIQKLKIAFVETMKDTGMVGPEAEQRLVDSTKVGVVEALKDTGMLDKQKEPQPPEENKVSISYKDLPPNGKVQAAEKAGIGISTNAVQVQDKKNEQIKKTSRPPVARRGQQAK